MVDEREEYELEKVEDDKLKYIRARKKVKKIKGFYEHLAVFVIVNTGLFAINIITSPQYLWFIWSVIGWGIGVLSHWFAIFGMEGIFGENWEERKIKEYMERDI